MISGITYYCLLMEANWYMSPSPGNIFVDKGENRIGSRYKKVVYREYTDDSFSVQKKRQPNQQHLGIIGELSCSLCHFYFTMKRLNKTWVLFSPVGPIIKAEVGEQVVITFKNKASRPYSITAHGVRASGAHIPVKPGENEI